MEHLDQLEAMKPPARETAHNPIPQSPTKSSARSSTPSTSFSRSGTLSWQQRPSSRDSNTSRSRPLSRHNDGTASAAGDILNETRTREQIALSLSSKDPSWFRQTPDRGASSDAYRKSREETQHENGQNSRQLPGMSRESSIELKQAPFSPSARGKSMSLSQATSAPDAISNCDRFSIMSSQPIAGVPSPLLPAKGSQRFGLPAETPESDQPDGNRAGLSSLHGQLARDRPNSPTKGLGGFVQSAMMKRSDSVNKRWSAQATPGLSRGNSIASYRGGLGNPASVIENPGSPPRETTISSRGLTSSPLAKSRPSSSHSASTVLHHAQSTTQPSLPPASSNDLLPESSYPSLTKITRLNENITKGHELQSTSPDLQSTETLPVSPTKTMDPKRWSPTKASWLESALARPESPKLTSPKPQTPSWMADLQRSKWSKEDSESVTSPQSSITILSPTGVVRSPRPSVHAQPLNIGGLPEGLSSRLTRKTSSEKTQQAATQENVSSLSTDGPLGESNPGLSNFSSAGKTREKVVEKKQSAQPTSSPVATMPSTSPTELSSDKSAAPGLKGAPPTARRNDVAILPSKLDEKSPDLPVSKPRAPPKTDFRAALRPRQNMSEENVSTEPEFKNIFGKLKRTETRNYVAPDDLKDNILKGKAALNLTGGPQRTKKVDEFKESILKRKESMKVEATLPRKNVTESGKLDTAAPKSAPLPEALAKRDALNKRANSTQVSVAEATQTLSSAASRSTPLKEAKRDVVSLNGQAQPGDKATHPSETGAKVNSVTFPPTLLEREPPSTQQAFAKEERATRAADKQATVSTSPPLEGQPSTASAKDSQSERNRPLGALASRLNPSLASIISRGPISAISSSNSSREDVSSSRKNESSSTVEPEASSACTLTHVTKGRARGPKRRLPNTAAPPAQQQDAVKNLSRSDAGEEALQKTGSGKPIKEVTSQGTPHQLHQSRKADVAPRASADFTNNNDKAAQPVVKSEQPVSPPSVGQQSWGPESGSLLKTESKGKTKPLIAPKSPTLRKFSSPMPSTSVSLAEKIDQKPLLRPEQISEHASSDGPVDERVMTGLVAEVSQPAVARQRESSTSASSIRSDKSAASPRRGLPNPPPTFEIKSTASPAQKPAISGLGLKLDSKKLQPPSSELTPPPDENSVTALNSWKTLGQARRKQDSCVQDLAALREDGSNVADLLRDFFGEEPQMTDKVEADAQAIILNRPIVDAKRTVLKMQVWQINADGRKEDPPPQQEHILFEDCMYLCVHSFETSSGLAATEVYLWSGDSVSEAAIEDAQLFCRREARENNAKLELLRQGKEPAKFFLALGGIVITRRSKTSALYMLCGRRHLGHIAFDEVDLSHTSLCSGFPYIISAKFGKLFLWKGRGSGADEVGCARLIGMDLGLTGEIEEVDEDEEPQSLLESLGGTPNRLVSSQQWSLRSKADRYGCRLFRIDLEQSKGMSGFWTRRGSSPSKATKAHIVELQPFCQRDLDGRSIFVLDAYFNIFV